MEPKQSSASCCRFAVCLLLPTGSDRRLLRAGQSAELFWPAGAGAGQLSRRRREVDYVHSAARSPVTSHVRVPAAR